MDVVGWASARLGSMDDLARLVAVEDIRVLKARYFRCIDTKDWDGLASLFTDDAVIDVTQDGATRIQDRESFVASVRSILADAETIHHGHTPEIEVESSDRATGVWAMEDRLSWASGIPMRSLHGFGYYHEEYRRQTDGWRISRLLLTRVRRQLDPPG